MREPFHADSSPSCDGKTSRIRIVHLILRWHCLSPMVTRSRAVFLVALLLCSAPVAAAEFPVLFIHGFCSSAETWDETIPQLSTRRFGTDVPRVYESVIGKAASQT